jgi:NAD(P)-dependent dehydrogenase (short-subunit alcohol dehydrogenase family)
MLSVDGRVVMISGATRGIGLAIARNLAAKGYVLSLGARDEEALLHLVEEMGHERIAVFRFDALLKSTHTTWIEATATRFGRIDALVNNAGISSQVTIEDDDEHELDRVWAVNVKAPLSLIRLALPHLKAAGTGRIVNVASLSGKRVRNDHVAYAMSKYAVMALTHAARRLGWEHGIRATALCPAFVATDMTADVTTFPRADMIDPMDLAELVATLLALPNNAAIAELLVNCRLEDAL